MTTMNRSDMSRADRQERVRWQVERIRHDADALSRDQAAFDWAITEERQAALSLAQAVVAAVLPAMPSVVAPLFAARSTHGCRAHGLNAGQVVHSEIRGLEVAPGVALGEDGTWYLDHAPQDAVESDGGCFQWDWQPIALEELLRIVPIETIVDGTAGVFTEQLEGRRAQRSRNAEERARKLRVLADMISRGER